MSNDHFMRAMRGLNDIIRSFSMRSHMIDCNFIEDGEPFTTCSASYLLLCKGCHLAQVT